MSNVQDPQYGLPNAPIATRLEAADPTEFGVPALKRGQGLNVTGLHPSWGGWFQKLRAWLFRPCATAYQNTTAQSIPTGTSTVLTFDTAAFDPSGLWNGASKFTAPVPGFYLLHAQVQFSTPGAGAVALQARKNGSVLAMPHSMGTLFAGVGNATIPLAGLVQLNASDFIEYMAFQSSGANQNTSLLTTWGGMALMVQP